MNVKHHIADHSSKAGSVLQREGEAGLPSDNPGKLTERLIEEISLRATMVGPVLEAILNDQHGHSRWGLNE
jgi:hypothetical protein